MTKEKKEKYEPFVDDDEGPLDVKKWPKPSPVPDTVITWDGESPTPDDAKED